MAQRTDVEVSPNLPSTQDPNAQSALPQSETHSAAPPPSGTARGRFRRNPATRWLIIGAVLVVLIGGFFAWRYFASYESTDDAQVDGHLMPLSARISGYVLKVNVDDNQFVKAGTVLAEIDPRDYQVAADQARANLADAEAQASSLGINVPITSISTTSQTSASEADVENAKAGVAGAQQQYDAAKAQLVQAQANDGKGQDESVRKKKPVRKQEI